MGLTYELKLREIGSRKSFAQPYFGTTGNVEFDPVDKVRNTVRAMQIEVKDNVDMSTSSTRIADLACGLNSPETNFRSRSSTSTVSDITGLDCTTG